MKKLLVLLLVVVTVVCCLSGCGSAKSKIEKDFDNVVISETYKKNDSDEQIVCFTHEGISDVAYISENGKAYYKSVYQTLKSEYETVSRLYKYGQASGSELQKAAQKASDYSGGFEMEMFEIDKSGYTKQ